MNHKEVVFLYDMLNDKAASINELYTKLHEKELIIKNLINQTENLITKDSSVDDIEVVEEEFKDVLEFCSEYRNDLDDEHDDVQNPVEEDSSDYQVQNEEIIKLYSMGYSTKEISKKLGIGTGEVALVNNLYNSSVIV
jgi:DNA-binding NarL/FixJ family response regulator